MIFLCIFAVLIISLLVLWCIVMWFKIDNDFDQQMRVLSAIELYANETGDIDGAVKMIDVMKESTRIWDWGYKNILPKAYLELIEHYIK